VCMHYTSYSLFERWSTRAEWPSAHPHSKRKSVSQILLDYQRILVSRLERCFIQGRHLFHASPRSVSSMILARMLNSDPVLWTIYYSTVHPSHESPYNPQQNIKIPRLLSYTPCHIISYHITSHRIMQNNTLRKEQPPDSTLSAVHPLPRPSPTHHQNSLIATITKKSPRRLVRTPFLFLYFFKDAEEGFCFCEVGESRCSGFQPEEAEAKLEILAVFCFVFCFCVGFELLLLFLLLLVVPDEDEEDEVEDGEREGEGGGD